MAKQPHQQRKILLLREILLRETDENHGLTMEQIISALEKEGISAERKSIYENMETLSLCGLEIQKERIGSATYYYALPPYFEEVELRLLADAVASSRFITQKKSEQLIEKLTALTSRHQGGDLKRRVYVADRIKNMNETVLYLIDDLGRAIAQGKAVEFRYFDWMPHQGLLKRIPRRNGAFYTCSPWQLLWQDQFYYLIAYDHGSGAIRHYRVDRMGEIRITDQPRQGEKEFEQIHMEDYTARLFGMFGGKTERVILSFPARLLDVMIDRFGKNLTPHPAENGRLTIHVNLIPSLPFYGWLTSLGEEVKIEAPAALRKAYLDTLKSIIKENENG